ncbi:hypothetical protein FB106_101411 [Synechococcus sp. Ace-Pa]|nr:hypothetical protein FB106_101411 [Synechococcus sp. Ace-Pa]
MNLFRNSRGSGVSSRPGICHDVLEMRQQVNTLIATNLHWQPNGELHPEDLERLRERLLSDQALDACQQKVLAGWMVEKQQQAA